jgi:N-alpha-acetyltransferase 15/16, NatA auxiliary subunit
MAFSTDRTSSLCLFICFRDYDNAKKAYINALKYDANNQNVLRDLGQLQIQLRDYEGYCETRRLILVDKPNAHTNWITYAISAYLVNSPN